MICIAKHVLESIDYIMTIVCILLTYYDWQFENGSVSYLLIAPLFCGYGESVGVEV